MAKPSYRTMAECAPLRMEFRVDRHVRFWKMHLAMLPRPYTSGDDQRYVYGNNGSMTLAYFCLAGLDLLQQKESVISEKDREAYLDWIYAQQLRTYALFTQLKHMVVAFVDHQLPMRCATTLTLGPHRHDIHRSFDACHLTR